MEVNASLNCCNYVELLGFNGKADATDEDINDATVYNMKAGVLAVADFMDAWEKPEYAAGSVFMTCAWDKYKKGDKEVAHLDVWSQPGAVGRKASTYKARMTRFIKYIKLHGLGTVHSVPDVTNPNHMSTIRTRIWHVDNKALIAWAADQEEPMKRGGIWDDDIDYGEAY